MRQRKTACGFWLAGVALTVLLLGTPWAASADEPGWWRHGEIQRFHEEDLRLWRGGHWVHERHSGRLGWWWVVGPTWYWYPAPIYPYPDPYVPPLAPAPPPRQVPAQYWYYCPSARGYYPYVPACPEAWLQVVPQPTPPQPPPAYPTPPSSPPPVPGR